VVVVGATGLLGRAVVEALEPRHEVVQVGHRQGTLTVELEDPDSILRLFRSVGRMEALVSAAGRTKLGPWRSLSDDDLQLGLTSKLMGQVNLVRHGLDFMADGGSFTLTSGALGRRPAPGSAALSLVNAGLEGFVRAAALDAPRGIRVNVVSPGWVTETLVALGMDPASGTPARGVARAYVRSLEGSETGAVIEP
jgi:NAD(P)-dependent dehydrogenase (short-subunit alcohol dehydrogenase family)